MARHPVIEQATESANDAARAVIEHVRGLVDAAERYEPPALQAEGAKEMTRRLVRAADVLRGADDEAQTLEDAVDRERLRAALIAGVVLAVSSLFVFLVAREIANRRAPAAPPPEGTTVPSSDHPAGTPAPEPTGTVNPPAGS